MSDAAKAFATLVDHFKDDPAVSVGQMFGKACLKVNGKAFVAHQQDLLAFKLTAPHHAEALSSPHAALWDPSSKGRPMKEWVALPPPPGKKSTTFAAAARAYVAEGA